MARAARWSRSLVWLVFVPAAIAAHLLIPDRHTIIFVLSAAGIVPLAQLIGRTTEIVTEHLGGGIGGLLNATFGNAAELIIGALALRRGLYDLVKASITGSIIGNVLLVFGVAAIVGGAKRSTQRFNRTAASMGATMLLLSGIGLVVPAIFHWLSRFSPDTPDLKLDAEISAILMVTYGLSLLFTLKTHRQLYEGQSARSTKRGPLLEPILVMLAATAGVTVMSELLVGTVSETARSLGMSELFVGVVIVALVGNAAEHYSAVTLAAQDQMDATLSIAVGSSIQIAVFVAPVLVFLSYVIAPQPMDLIFTVFEVAAIGLSVLIMAFIAQDGETNWMEGVQLVAVYLILALGFFFLPAQN